MKFLLVAVALVGLWGCGPEQSAADRDQQTIDANYQHNKAMYSQFVGIYDGTKTGGDQTVPVALRLRPFDNPQVSSGREGTLLSPTVVGELLFCFTKNCFNSLPFNENIIDNSNQVTPNSNFNESSGVLVLNTAQSTTACGGSAASVCAAYTISLQWNSNHTALTGTMIKAQSNEQQTVILNKIQ